MKYRPIAFPRDGSFHDNIIEWWYFNGHLKDRAGNHYAFMDCLFKANPRKVKLPFLEKVPLRNAYFAHSLLSDIGKRKFHSSVHPLSLVSTDSFSKPRFFVNYTCPSVEGYLNYEIEETGEFEYRIKSKFFDLAMKSAKKPLLEGGRGFVELETKQTFYYSLTSLKTEGYVTINGRRIRVEGKSWMDHQWADAPYAKDRWSWFSIQLDSGMELVCFEYDDKGKKIRLASISYANGSTAHTGGLLLVPLGKAWKSRITGAEYPLSWRISVPSKNIDLVVDCMVKEQEMIFGSINYWEGPMSVRGKVDGRKVAGKGFAELVGYPARKSFVEFCRPELRRIRKLIGSHFKGFAAHWVGRLPRRKPGQAGLP